MLGKLRLADMFLCFFWLHSNIQIDNETSRHIGNSYWKLQLETVRVHDLELVRVQDGLYIV